jgi:hypothetical protein
MIKFGVWVWQSITSGCYTSASGESDHEAERLGRGELASSYRDRPSREAVLRAQAKNYETKSAILPSEYERNKRESRHREKNLDGACLWSASVRDFTEIWFASK